MGYRPGDAYTKLFTTANPSTGAAVNADSLPVATANHNGTDDGSFSLTVTNIDTGRYKITGTVPSGYVGGDVLNVTVAATVSGVAGKQPVDTQVIDRPPVIQKAAALNNYPIYAVSSSDHVSPATGATITIKISKDGGAFGNPSAGGTNAVEISNGFYKFSLSATDTNCNTLAVLGTGTGVDPIPLSFPTTP